MTALDTNCGHINNAEEAHVTTSYENNHHELLFGMDCQILQNEPDNRTLSSSVSPSDPDSFSAFFQSIVHNSNNIFQPQPMVAPTYHQLLHLPNEAPLQTGSFEQVTTDCFANTHASPQSASSIFENDNFQVVSLPYEFLPLGAAASSLTESTHIQTMANNTVLYHLPPYYQNLTSHNLTPEHAPDSRPGPSSQERLQSVSSAVSAVESGRNCPGNDGDTQCAFQSQEQDQNRAEESLPAGDLDVVFSSCALADTSSISERTLVQSLSPSCSSKRSHSVAPASDGLTQLKHSALTEVSKLDSRSSFKNQPKPSKTGMKKSSSQSSPKIKPKNLKRNRPERLYAQPNLISRQDQLVTPSRPNILANKKIHPNILPPTPDSLQRPKNQCCSSRDEPENTEESGQKKKRKIASIEKALEALDTLTEYLSQEANECTTNGDDTSEYRNQLSPQQHACNSSLSLVSPQHFFTLGELGGRLRRRLDVHRR